MSLRPLLSRLPLGLALLLSAAAPAAELPPCQGSTALRFVPTGVPARVELAMSVELEVEARRLGLVACRGGSEAPVEAVVRWADDVVHLEVRGAASRVVTRDLAPPELSDQGVLETALILGDLVHEALAPAVMPTAPSPSRWLLGARVGVEGVLVKGTTLFGGALTARYEWHALGLELDLGGSTSNSTALAQGAVGLSTVGGTLLGGWRFARPWRTSVVLELGAQVSALQVSVAALPGVGATPNSGWTPVADARAGLLVEVPLNKVGSLRVGAAWVLAGVAVRADGATAVQFAGPLLNGSLGVSWRSGGAP